MRFILTRASTTSPAHDGFTLYDLVSYDRKHNEANGHNNTDGADENYSWNCGWEGDEGVPAHVLELRKRQAKNFCCLLLLANGTPMFRAGDEFLQTQGGNNNPYNQDNATSWLDWDRLRVHQDVFRFFRSMIALPQGPPFPGPEPLLARGRALVRHRPDGGHGPRFAHAGLLPRRGLATGHRSLRDDQRRRRTMSPSRFRKGGPANGGWPSTPAWSARTTFPSRRVGPESHRHATSSARVPSSAWFVAQADPDGPNASAAPDVVGAV